LTQVAPAITPAIPTIKPPKDAFAKVYRNGDNQRAQDAKATGMYPYFKAISHHGGGTVIVDGEEFILTGSNDYLGLTQDPRIRAAAHAALDAFGPSCTGSRYLTGTLTIHEELEEELADFLGKESTMVFGAGFLACASSVAALAGRHDLVYFDRENHASLLDGIKLAGCTMLRYDHNDAADLEAMLEKDKDNENARLIYTEGIFSMSGHIGNVDEVVALAQRYGARVICDDAHATGVLGPHGEGAHFHFNIQDQVDVVVGTFSKSFASVGGFIAGDKAVVEFIKHTARGFIFNAALPAPSAAAALAALRIMRSESQHREHLWQNVSFMRENLKTLGFDLLGSDSPIIPVLVGEDETATGFWQALWQEHIFTTPAVSPAVPKGRAIIRTSYNSAHTQEHLERVLRAFEKVGRSFGVIG
jgi:8-amino-7-oxononanoate synthase